MKGCKIIVINGSRYYQLPNDQGRVKVGTDVRANIYSKVYNNRFEQLLKRRTILESLGND